ncbi:hypothetical protein PybrP1_003804 [[Pythium] brassicae (nom. inval.)]|nr:hypothetical protein PybrP1_003804 [[Pythium] brassicae (nom. inval.)]
MLLNQILFWLMIVEAVVCLIISLPFGHRATQAVVQFIAARIGGRDSIPSIMATVMLALVSILFLSDVSTCYKHHSTGAVLSDGMRIRLLTAQRDMYISGFALFLFLLLRLVYTAIVKNIRLEKSLSAMQKQAEGASTGYKQQLEENDAMKQQLAKLHALVGVDDDENDKTDNAGGKTSKKPTDVLATLVAENAALTTQLAAATKAVATAESHVATIKKQAEGQSAAFGKLLDEKHEADKHRERTAQQQAALEQQAQEIKELKAECDSLRSQIQDYDFMFAEAKKKAE